MHFEAQKQRIDSIDALRGLVILVMLLDHVRERFFYNHPITDPMSIVDTPPELFFSRFAAHFCAPAFVFLTGLSAWLFRQKQTEPVNATRSFLFKRGLFLIALEMTVINFSWFGAYEVLYLQVIWAIGVSMIILALLLNLPSMLIGWIGLVIVAGHNAFDFINLSPGERGYTAWAILHDRGIILQSELLAVKASYPVLPWFGVIFLGYAAGPLYSAAIDRAQRLRWLLGLSLACFGSFVLLRGFNVYGENLNWQVHESMFETFASFLNVTKYPPSLNFIQITFTGIFLMLYLMERFQGRWTQILKNYGGAPMFFYLLHLYVLLVLYKIGILFFPVPNNEYLSLPNMYWVWATTLLLAGLLYFPTRWFNHYKRTSNKAWVKYF
ncbi:DUF1624 domain-containing protein [Salinimonas chungwhensis]|uniref:DUF1624 domain-containing protein n=1 Tax=Salinimonas chungwhensis TaxID=265425 RepID=UPI0003759E1E|nr:heparan-alpha-glucosaminide N-acetyltransferase domain-containing protein [Salinimonas chungwhensis]